ncbi:MAG: ABC transporter ATP-binding protein [Betaproteobacteria bacterium]
MQITLRNVTKRFGRTEALKDVSLTIGDGDFFTLLGPSGCGKTTTLRVIAGFHPADEGDVFFDQQRVNDLPPSRRNIGIVFQNLALWPHMTVRQNVAYGLRLRRIPKLEIERRVRDSLDKVGLAGFEDRYPGQLSGGQQQRVALARALVLNPGVLLLDEPLSSLDAKVRLRLRAEIRKLQQDLKITTVCVTHDQEEALTMSDCIAVMSEGRVLQVGTPRELYQRPASVFVADFVGANNLVWGTVQAVADGRCRLATPAGTIVGVAATGEARLSEGQPAAAAFRPEAVTLAEDADGGRGEATEGVNLLSGQVAFSSYMGNNLRYEVAVSEGIVAKVDIRDPVRHTVRPLGARVTLSFPVESTLIIPDGATAGSGHAAGDAPGKVGEAR